MARGQGTETERTFEQLIRRISRNEISKVLSNALKDENETSSPTMAVASAAPLSRPGRRKKGAGKGRVVNPNDKRLKRNREKSANA